MGVEFVIGDNVFGGGIDWNHGPFSLLLDIGVNEDETMGGVLTVRRYS